MIVRLYVKENVLEHWSNKGIKYLIWFVSGFILTHLHLVMTHSEPPAQENEAFDLADLMKNCLHFKQTVEDP